MSTRFKASTASRPIENVEPITDGSCAIQSLVLIPSVSAFSVIARSWLLQRFSPSWASVSAHKISRSILPLLRALPLLCFLPLLCCCHDPFIVRSAQTRLTFHWFHSACRSVSMFTINAGDCLFLLLSPGLCVCVGAAPPHQIRQRLVTVILKRSVGSMINRIPILQTCNVVVVLKQRPASFQHLPSSSLWAPSGTRSCIKKYRVSMCFVRCPALHRSSKKISIELSHSTLIFIGIPRYWYVDLRENPTRPPFTTA